jgi:hypothetical protein
MGREETMTDNEIIKALEYCSCKGISLCDKCPYIRKCGKLSGDALGLITRQQARIGRVDDELAVTRLLVLHYKLKYDKAIKEFAERLCDGRVSNDPIVIATRCLVKEMMEG